MFRYELRPPYEERQSLVFASLLFVRSCTIHVPCGFNACRVKLHPKSIALRDAELTINKGYARIEEAERDMRTANGEGMGSDAKR